ncbi:MAG: hypothetical protein A2987_04665 [Omnitrophica bacterium RIFCSPLOWO2_01_FULL_45_10]|nr:MAG: hypothetical protein A2987_04665 [Omnitrophica bacterium RIFCSPLOWO2_01_FULL_45_10]
MWFTLDRAIIYIVSRSYNLSIDYDGLKNEHFRHFTFKDLSAIDNRRGLGFKSGYAKLNLIGIKGLSAATCEFELHNVSLIKKGESALDRYGDIAGLVSAPFASRWRYKDVIGRVRLFGKGIVVEKFKAESEDIKLSLSGTILSDDTLTCDLIIYFSEALTGNIPEELSEVVLRNESNGWKSLSVKLTGNYRSPSIQVAGQMFRLNIKEVS